MIFKSVSDLNSKAETSFYIEQINVYIRLVEVYCEKNQKSISDSVGENWKKELFNIGVIKEEKELVQLKKILGEQYDKFVQAVKYAVDHKDEMGDLLDKLSNQKRKTIQEKNKMEKVKVMQVPTRSFCN